VVCVVVLYSLDINRGEAMSKKIRVVVCVEGGNVVSVYTHPIEARNISVEVVDYDNLEADGMTMKEASDYGLKATDGMKNIL
jgi:hypothetical protein